MTRVLQIHMLSFLIKEEKYNIHKTRQGFPNNGIDTFTNMAEKGVFITDRIIQEQMMGGVDLIKDMWYIPDDGLNITVSK